MDLPPPLGPTIPTNSPGSTLKESSCAPKSAAAVVERYVSESERGPNRLRGHINILFRYREAQGARSVSPDGSGGEIEEVIHFFGVDPRFLQVDMGAQQRLQHGVGAGQVGDEGHEAANGQSSPWMISKAP